MRIYVIEHHVTEVILETLSAWILRGELNDTSETVNLYKIFTL